MTSSHSPFDLGPESKLQNVICIPDRTQLIMSSRNDLPGTNITLRQMFVVVGGICMGLAGVISLFNFCSHLVWRSNLKEQKHLMRLSVMPFMFCLFSWCGLIIYGLGRYLDPIPSLYEMYCITTFFHFAIEVLHLNEKTRTEFFIQVERIKSRKMQVHDKGSLRWYQGQHVMVHAPLFCLLVTTIVEEILTYYECRSESENQAATLIIAILSTVFTIMALLSLLRTWRRFREEYQGAKIMRKFWTLKGFVFFYIWQSFIMTIIVAAGAVTPTEYMTMADFTYGIFGFMVCCEAFLFSVFSIWTVSGLTYRRSHRLNEALRRPPGPDASVGKYLVAFFFPKDIFIGAWQAFHYFGRLVLGRKRFDYTGGTIVGWKERQGGAYQSLTNADAYKEELEDTTSENGAA